MAENFNQSIISLSNNVDALSRTLFDLREREVKRLLEGRSFTRLKKEINAIAGYDTARNALRKAADIHEAKLAMRRDPEHWASPSEYLEWRDIRKRQKSLGVKYVQEQKKAFDEYNLNRGGPIPFLFRNNISKYGANGGRQAFQNAVNDMLFQINDPTAYAYEQEKRMYGDENARRFQNAREEKERRHNHYNYLRKQVAERRDLYNKAPWAKALIKSGIIDQKYIPNISKTVDKIAGLPLVGYGMRMAIKHPILSASLGAYALLGSYLNKSVSSDQLMTSIKVGQKAFGPVPHWFRVYTAATGMKEEQTQKEWFGLQEKYGPAAPSVLLMASKAMEGKSPFQRQQIAQAYGIDANLVRAADMTTEIKPMDKGERVTLASHFTDIRKEYGFSSDSDFTDFLNSVFLSLPGMSSASAYIAGHNDWAFKLLQADNARINKVISGVNASQAAAESAVRYESQGPASSVTTNNNTGGTVTINQVIYASGNAQEIAEKVGDETKEVVGRQRVMDAITTGDKQ